MTHEDVVTRVRLILNEHGSDDSLTIATDRVLLDDYIERAIPDAVVLLTSKGFDILNDVAHVDVGDNGEIEVSNFLSLISINHNSWKKRVYKLTDRNSPAFIMAQNTFTKPGPNSPIAWLHASFSDKVKIRTLPELPKTADSNTAKVSVFYNKTYNKNSGLGCGEPVSTAVCYMAAAIVLGLFGDEMGEKRLSELSTTMLQ